MTPKMDSPGALAGATEANMKAASFMPKEYPLCTNAATPFTHISTAAFRVVHLVGRYRVTAEHAAMLATLVYGESQI